MIQKIVMYAAMAGALAASAFIVYDANQTLQRSEEQYRKHQEEGKLLLRDIRTAYAQIKTQKVKLLGEQEQCQALPDATHAQTLEKIVCMGVVMEGATEHEKNRKQVAAKLFDRAHTFEPAIPAAITKELPPYSIGIQYYTSPYTY